MRIIVSVLLVLVGCGEKTTDGPDASPPLDALMQADTSVFDEGIQSDAQITDAATELDASEVDAALPDATLGVCGNGRVENDEACDDANRTQGDGCDPLCQLEAGYACEGEPSECVRLDPCSESINPCDTNAACEVVDEAATCTCADGYFGNGARCALWTECTPEQFEQAPGTEETDRTCEAISICDNTQFESTLR